MPSWRKTSLVLATLLFTTAPLLFPPVSNAAGDTSNAPSNSNGIPNDSSGVLHNSEVRRFIDRMVTQHGYPRESLQRLFATVRFMPELRERLARPAEALPWYRYRAIFLTTDRIDAGVEFWHTHRDILARAEKAYGVPAKVIVGILGVETYFGKRQGKYPVLDSLATLAFQNSIRTGFFRGEIEQFLLLINEEALDAHALKGSYAGAMGLPQFISSSYRRYAVDFDGDNRRDLFGSVADAIGSAAHYLAEHGWQRNRGIAVPAQVQRVAITDDLLMKKRGSRPHIMFSVLRERGVSVATEIPDDEKIALVRLETQAGPAYWIGRQNFYAITRYNHSNLYAMAVYQLAEAIRAGYLQAGGISRH